MPSCQDLSSLFSLLLSRIAQLMELLHDVIKVDDKVKNSMFSDASGQAGKLYDISQPFPITGSSLYLSFLDFHSHSSVQFSSKSVSLSFSLSIRSHRGKQLSLREGGMQPSLPQGKC